MSRLLVHVEGRTEVLFVNEVLAPHLYDLGYVSVRARIMGGIRQSRRRGGVRSWESALYGIVENLRSDSGIIVSTMVDYYGMPPSWPGRIESSAASLTVTERAGLIENALLEDVSRRMDRNFDLARFIPYVMMHEFEAMLFSDYQNFAISIGHPNLRDSFQAIRDEFASPEDIDDSPTTAPSKRIEELFPGYEKPLMGTLVVRSIGLDTIRRECPHFADWLARLESMP